MVLLLGALAVGIELLGDLPDALLLFSPCTRGTGTSGNNETRGIQVDPQACFLLPSIRYVDTAAQDAEMKGVLKSTTTSLCSGTLREEEREYSMMCVSAGT